MEFEWDENKNKTNILKHNISFNEAKILFENDIYYLKEAKTKDNEVRYAISSYIEEKCFTAIFTIRNNKIRLISVRRCHKNEEKRLKNGYNS